MFFVFAKLQETPSYLKKKNGAYDVQSRTNVLGHALSLKVSVCAWMKLYRMLSLPIETDGS